MRERDFPTLRQQTTVRRWYSAFHNTTAIVGAGVLGLPFAMKYLMWPGGVIILLLSYFTSLYTLWQVSLFLCGRPAPIRFRLAQAR